jgi:TonB family protein
MTSAVWIRDVIAVSVQLAVIITAGAALAAALRLRTPKVMLLYWQVLLAACIVLPLCQPRQEAQPPAAVTERPPLHAEAPQFVAVNETLPFVPRRPMTPELSTLILWSLGAGTAVRGLWLAIGGLRLRRLRRSATPLVPVPSAFAAAQDRLGIGAAVYVSDRIAGPVTFGVVRPIVLLPRGTDTLAPHVQDAIAYHELLHVRRRDWLWEIAEEAVRTIFWFHPAVRWLIGRVQLSREQVVDQTVIALTESRDRYIDALLVVALAKSPAALVPAPLFLRKRLLKKRVAQILQETTMTTRHLIASLTASAAALSLAAIVAVRSFPLEAQGQNHKATPAAEANGREPIQIVKGGEHLLHGSLPDYPKRAFALRVEGDVIVELALDERGEVSDARVLTGPDELRRAALESVLQWHYAPASLRSTTVQATLRFRLPAEVSEPMRGEAFTVEVEEKASAQRLERRIVELQTALEDPSASASQRVEWKMKLADTEKMLEKIREDQHAGWESSGEVLFKEVRDHGHGLFDNGQLRLVQIRSERVTPETMKELIARSGISVGDVLTKETAKRVGEAATSIDEHLSVRFSPHGKDGVVITVLNP